MNSDSMPQGSPAEAGDKQLERREGIIKASTDPTTNQVEVDFDGSVLSHGEVREILHDHITRVASAIERQTYRLHASGCEACAQKLEKRIRKIPGIQRATATYAGKVLSVHFDTGIKSSDEIESDLRGSGARIGPLAKTTGSQTPVWKRLVKGEWNDEISCGLGLAFLVAAFSSRYFTDQSAVSTWLYVGAYLFAGQEGVRSAIASLRERVLDVDVLMVLAALGAAWIGHPLEGALLLFLFSFSNVLQSHAMDRTQRAIESLLTLRPTQALVKRDGTTTSVPVEDIRVGEQVIVRPGEQIPVDGILTEGTTHVDESSLTGESMPVSKSPGNPLFTGTINQSGGIELKVTKRAEDSTLARMVKLVAEAQAEKSKTQRFLERAEQIYAMGVIIFTAGVFLVGWLMVNESFQDAFYRAMTIMVVASPCALIISTPATVLSAIGGAARQGILIKGGSHLERCAHIDIVAVDKTGTLTVGKPSLTDWVTADSIHPLDRPLPDEVMDGLRIASGVEAKSEHPLAEAILRKARDLDIHIPEASNFQSTPGKGAEARIGGQRVLIGNERMFRESGADNLDSFQGHAQQLQQDGKTCVWLGRREDDQLTVMAVLALADTLRSGAESLTLLLKELGVKKVVMLTGDQRLAANAMAKRAGVDEAQAELLPEDKLQVIRELKRDGRVMMIGDGVNDAPALALADVGVAMGAAGTDVAMETADVILMSDRLANIPLLLEHARRARRVLLQNLAFASAVIVVLIAVTLGFTLALPLGVIGHEGSTVLVCLNGLRLLRLSAKP